MYMHQESNTKLTRTCEKLSTQTSVLTTPLALPHYDTYDVSVIADLPYMAVSHDLGQQQSAQEHVAVHSQASRTCYCTESKISPILTINSNFLT